jgi:hypothetical protein
MVAEDVLSCFHGSNPSVSLTVAASRPPKLDGASLEAVQAMAKVVAARYKRVIANP